MRSSVDCTCKWSRFVEDRGPWGVHGLREERSLGSRVHACYAKRPVPSGQSVYEDDDPVETRGRYTRRFLKMCTSGSVLVARRSRSLFPQSSLSHRASVAPKKVAWIAFSPGLKRKARTLRVNGLRSLLATSFSPSKRTFPSRWRRMVTIRART